MNIKEKRNESRKTACLFVILFPVILIGGYYAYSAFIVFQVVNSFGKTFKKSTKRSSIKRQETELAFLHSNLLKVNEHSAFTGIEERNDTIFTNALSITAIDSFSIKYRIESLVNWKSKDNVEGIAQLDTMNYNRRIIDHKRGSVKDAFVFFEKKGDCLLEIMISKEKGKHSLRALVKEKCGLQETKRLTVVMRFK